MENEADFQARHPQCERVEKPTLFSHVAEEDMPFYCVSISQGHNPEGQLKKGEKVAIKSEEDPERPWIITKDGIVAQVEGSLRSIPL